ncbi:MAG: hypothetical protein ACYT04_26225 [Nostoc sp.]
MRREIHPGVERSQLIGSLCDRFSISSQKIPEVQKPQAVLGFGSTSYVCAWSQ